MFRQNMPCFKGLEAVVRFRWIGFGLDAAVSKRFVSVRIWFVLAALLVPSVAFAQGKPRSIEDCELVKEPLAYNACLASFGPARNGEGPRVTAVPDNADTRSVRRSSRRGKVVRGRGGRVRAEFSVGGSRTEKAVQSRRKVRAQRGTRSRSGRRSRRR